MSSYKPDDSFPAISPYLLVRGLPEFVEFAENCFGAKVTAQTANDQDVLYYATLGFDGSAVMAQEAEGNPMPAAIYFYVPNLDEVYKKALQAGALSIAEPQMHYHGDKNAAIQDKWGNQWWLAQSVEFRSDEEVAAARKAQ